ncbi:MULTISPECIES: Acg family FMN-binding oxidoreductase [unclassified Streptomyces]|uniref:Acg family FMN-binding oxidoreductase n=1 Tax=unclassified Streptomyces TaxID=2593676 RepID=UPI003D71D58C
MPARPLDPMTVRALVAAATAAPSLHNAQPWRFRYRSADHVLELRADFERAMPYTDPDHRALHIGCGAALFNLRVAAAHHGLGAPVRLLPDAAEPGLLAAVRPAATDQPDHSLAVLHPAIPRRHTSRHPFRDEPVPFDVRDELSAAARAEGAQLFFPDPWHVAALLNQIHDAEGRDLADPERTDEVRRWTRVGPEAADAAVDGIPEYAFGPSKYDGGAPVRDFAGRRHLADRTWATFEPAPNMVLLGTRHDRAADWLTAGQALERVLLLATLHGLATALASHSLERSDLRELARDPASDMGYVHMILRIGHGPAGTASPRRPVPDVLDIV